MEIYTRFFDLSTHFYIFSTQFYNISTQIDDLSTIYPFSKEWFSISGFIIDLLVDIAGEIIEFLIPDRFSKSKFEKHLIRLREEDWFTSLEKDVRYAYIIHQNRKVRRFLSSEQNIKMITSMDFEREKFINLVKEEHAKFTGIQYLK